MNNQDLKININLANTQPIKASSGSQIFAQGVILLFLDEEAGELKRSLIVRKVRGTAHSLKRYPLEISKEGIIVMPRAEV